MAISYSYPMGTPKLTDTVLGVQYEEMKDPAVKNFSIGDIVTLVTEEAYTPTLQQVVDKGNVVIAGALNTLTLTGSTVSILNPISSEGIALRRDSLRFYKNDSFDTNLRMDLLSPSTITADRSIEFPDADGTVALTTDIPTPIVKNIKVTLTSAQLLNLFSTPVELVPAVTGKLLIPQFLFQKYNHVSSAYTTSGSFRIGLDSINFGFVTFSAVITSADNAQGLNNFSYSQSTSGLTYQNLPIVVGATTANPTGGNGTLDLYLTYLEVTL